MWEELITTSARRGKAPHTLSVVEQKAQGTKTYCLPTTPITLYNTTAIEVTDWGSLGLLIPPESEQYSGEEK